MALKQLGVSEGIYREGRWVVIDQSRSSWIDSVDGWD